MRTCWATVSRSLGLPSIRPGLNARCWAGWRSKMRWPSPARLGLRWSSPRPKIRLWPKPVRTLRRSGMSEIAAPDNELLADIEEAMRDVVDPELGINVVDLGLVYGVNLEEADEGTVALFDMTMKSP